MEVISSIRNYNAKCAFCNLFRVRTEVRTEADDRNYKQRNEYRATAEWDGEKIGSSRAKLNK